MSLKKKAYMGSIMATKQAPTNFDIAKGTTSLATGNQLTGPREEPNQKAVAAKPQKVPEPKPHPRLTVWGDNIKDLNKTISGLAKPSTKKMATSVLPKTVETSSNSGTALAPQSVKKHQNTATQSPPLYGSHLVKRVGPNKGQTRGADGRLTTKGYVGNIEDNLRKYNGDNVAKRVSLNWGKPIGYMTGKLDDLMTGVENAGRRVNHHVSNMGAALHSGSTSDPSEVGRTLGRKYNSHGIRMLGTAGEWAKNQFYGTLAAASDNGRNLISNARHGNAGGAAKETLFGALNVGQAAAMIMPGATVASKGITGVGRTLAGRAAPVVGKPGFMRRMGGFMVPGTDKFTKSSVPFYALNAGFAPERPMYKHVSGIQSVRANDYMDYRQYLKNRNPGRIWAKRANTPRNNTVTAGDIRRRRRDYTSSDRITPPSIQDGLVKTTLKGQLKPLINQFGVYNFGSPSNRFLTGARPVRREATTNSIRYFASNPYKVSPAFNK